MMMVQSIILIFASIPKKLKGMFVGKITTPDRVSSVIAIEQCMNQ
jgi:hypothetical protein